MITINKLLRFSSFGAVFKYLYLLTYLLIEVQSSVLIAQYVVSDSFATCGAIQMYFN